jgi:dehydrogenase/reductase SDR family member 1
MALAGKIALVTGGSRGVGRGVARALGEAGATVYLTARTSGPLEAAAREVDGLGGRGIPVRCDHAKADEIAALFARIGAESGRLDILVNNVHGGVPDIVEGVDRRFWELDPGVWDRMNDAGLRGHYLASYHAARMMVPRRTGLIVNVSSFGSLSYLFNAAYGIGKAAADRMTRDLALELRPEGVAVVSLWPGLVRTELTEAALKDATPGYRRIFEAYGESPSVAGRAVAGLASDPAILRRSGSVQIAAEVMRRLALVDESGKRPLSPRSYRTFFLALLPGGWHRLAVLAPPGNVPLWLVARVITRFSVILREHGGYRGK